MAKAKGFVYQRGNQWWIEFRYKGVRYREAVGPDEKLAEDVLAKRKVEIRENRFFPDKVKQPDPIRFHQFAKKYVLWAKTNKKASTCSREIYIMRLLDKEFEGKNIHEITNWHIEKYKAQRKEKLKAGTVNRELCLIKHLFSMAVEWGDIKENPAKKVKSLKGMTKRVRYLVPDEIQKVLSNCDVRLGGLLKPLVTVAVHIGARKGELLGLKWDQVNFDQGIISLLDTKNGERKDIPMNETVRATLQTIKRRNELVFPNRNGKHFDDAQIHLAFRAALDKSGITDFRFHDLRHTFASNLAMERVDLYVIAQLLGHKSLAMTRRYAHLSPKHKTRVVNILDRVMAQKSPQEEKMVALRG